MLVWFLDLSFVLPGQDAPATGSTAGGVQNEQGSAALSPYPASAQQPPASGAPAPAPALHHTPTPDSSTQSSSSAGPGPVSPPSAHPAPTGRLSPTQPATGSDFIPQQPPAPAPAGSEGGGAMTNKSGVGTEQASSMPAASVMPAGPQVPNLQQTVPAASAAATAPIPVSQAQGCGESEGESQSKSPGIEDIHALDKKLRSLFMDQNSVSSSSTQPENAATEAMSSPPGTVTSSPPLGTSNQMLPASQPVASGQSDMASAPTPADAGATLVSCHSASNVEQIAALSFFVWDVNEIFFLCSSPL